MEHFREYCSNRVRGIATFEDIWKIRWLKPLDGRRTSLSLWEITYKSSHASPSYMLSVSLRDIAVLTRIWFRVILPEGSRSASSYIFQELISFERTGRDCWNIWKTRTLHPTGRVLLILHCNVAQRNNFSDHATSQSALQRAIRRLLHYSFEYQPIFRSFRIMTLWRERERER